MEERRTIEREEMEADGKEEEEVVSSRWRRRKHYYCGGGCDGPPSCHPAPRASGRLGVRHFRGQTATGT